MQVLPMTEGAVEPERISPEGLEVANSYLVTNSIKLTSKELNMPPEMVADQLHQPLVKRYIDTVFMDTGYRNKTKLANTLDEVIDTKLEEMKEAEISSSKDISDLLAQAHKLRMDELKLQVEVIKAENALRQKQESGTTVNIQDNSLGGSNYGELMKQLLKIEEPK